MKTNSFAIRAAGIAASIITPALALEAPADNSPPPAVDAPAPAAEIAPAQEQKAGFLGVVTRDVPEALSEHLDLKQGEGVMVRALQPDGPAEKAGIAVNDIITKVGDKPVASQQELSDEVQAHQAGDTVRIDLIHKGKPAGIDVTLAARPDGLAALNPQIPDPLNLDGIPEDLADRVRGAIEGNLGGIELQLGDAGIGGAEERIEAMREMRKQIEKAMRGLNPDVHAGGRKIEIQQGAAIRMMDNEGSIELKSNEGGKEVTLRDKDNKITWNGPWDTDQDKAAAPEGVRQRVERLNFDTKIEGGGLQLRMHARGLGEDDE